MSNFFEVDFLEAGEKSSGDAICLRYRDVNDYTHVVDGGYKDDGDSIAAHIRKYYEEEIFVDHVVLTHPDGDHAAGLKTVLEEFNVGYLWMNRPWEHVSVLLGRFNYDYTETGLRQRLRKDFPHTAELEDIADERGIEIRHAFQGAQIGAFTVLAPSVERYLDLIVDSEKTPEPERAAAMKGRIYERVMTMIKSVVAVWGQENLKGESEGTSCENETSLVQFAELCGKKILLTGDAGVKALAEAYDYAVNAGVLLPGIDWFQVPHHGSRRNLSSEILDAWLGPKLQEFASVRRGAAVVSANHRDGDHPRKAVVRALIHRGAKVYQTKGTLWCYQNAPDRGWSTSQQLQYPQDMEE